MDRRLVISPVDTSKLLRSNAKPYDEFKLSCKAAGQSAILFAFNYTLDEI